MLIGSPHSIIKSELVSSFNYTEVFDENGLMHDFLTFDTGVRLGIYRKVFVYIEAGLDAFEIFLNDTRDEDSFFDLQENNSIDGFAGLGAGFHVKNFRVEGFVKARQIDGDTWDNDKKYFTDCNFLHLFKHLSIKH